MRSGTAALVTAALIGLGGLGGLGTAGGVGVRGVAAGQSRFRTQIDLVSLGVTVVDRDGRLVTDLTRDDFVIVEDGVPQTVQYFARGDDLGGGPPLHLGLLFDTSGSMGEDIRLSRTAAIRFLDALPEAEDMTLVEFDSDVRISRFSQDDFPRLVERIRGRRPSGFTALYDALGTYLAGAAEIDGRKVLVVYSDGGDARSSISWPDTLTLLQASDVTVYVIGFLRRVRSAGPLADRARLHRLAETTGGQAFFPGNLRDVEEAYEQVLAELRAQYTLGYVSTNTTMDGGWREVSIAATRSDLDRPRVRARAGYYALFREPSP